MVKAAGLSRVGQLSTNFTMERGFYRAGSKPPTTSRSSCPARPTGRYLLIIERLAERGAEEIITGCTEIELLVTSDDAGLPYIPPGCTPRPPWSWRPSATQIYRSGGASATRLAIGLPPISAGMRAGLVERRSHGVIQPVTVAGLGQRSAAFERAEYQVRDLPWLVLACRHDVAAHSAQPSLADEVVDERVCPVPLPGEPAPQLRLGRGD